MLFRSVQWGIGVPLISALLLSVLNALMGCGRGLYQVAQDGVLPTWFGRLNQNGVPSLGLRFNQRLFNALRKTGLRGPLWQHAPAA